MKESDSVCVCVCVYVIKRRWVEWKDIDGYIEKCGQSALVFHYQVSKLFTEQTQTALITWHTLWCTCHKGSESVNVCACILNKRKKAYMCDGEETEKGQYCGKV